MKDGGFENKKELENSKNQSKSSKFYIKSDDFALAIAKVAVAQVCESVGFQSFQHSAANLAGRVEANVFDVIQGLEELESGLGFAVPWFPVVKEWKGIGSFWEKGEDPHEEHIPSWLPAFPDPETYAARSSVGNGTMTASNEVKNGLLRVERKIERPLLNFQQQFAHNGNEGGSSHVVGDKVNSRNPVPEICFVGNQVSVLETFAPAIEAMKSGICEYGNGQKNVLYSQRPMVHFKFGIGKKPLGTAPDFNSKNKNLEKIV
ncbi:hypothetical protein ERO13_D04G042950v2 [Gossypium hirsutum]|uniref:Transcription initiation factor TFIID subunit 8 n=1 Tax=Gossypium barbadense TaxID=3634 RepID=A0A5J5RUD8_GOSBA|nr:hypothetical protein ES319_D04G047800v1 [Gossypium barbadense]KAG4151099.1 hypothetical protein ERO13_D04G042950v2 [Gossypium hirsutum]